MGDEDDEPTVQAADATPPGEAEQRFGVNLRSLREARGMSQVRFAEEMTGRGWPWKQQTVTRVETGRRMVRFGEAHAAAAILDVTLDRLTWAGPEATAAALVSSSAGHLRRDWREAAGAIARLYAARAAAERAAEQYRASEYARARDAARGLDEEIAYSTLDSALTEARAIWERARRGGG